MKKRYFIFVLLVYFLCTNLLCGQNGENKALVNDQQILTILLRVSKQKGSNQEVIAVERILLGKGFLKGKTNKTVKPNDNQLIISFLDSKQTVVHQQIMDNPLLGRYEYVNEEGDLTSVQLPVEAQTIATRVNYTKELDSIRIEKITKNKIYTIHEFKITL
jgi:hypothetical protein